MLYWIIMNQNYKWLRPPSTKLQWNQFKCSADITCGSTDKRGMTSPLYVHFKCTVYSPLYISGVISHEGNSVQSFSSTICTSGQSTSSPFSGSTLCAWIRFLMLLPFPHEALHGLHMDHSVSGQTSVSFPLNVRRAAMKSGYYCISSEPIITASTILTCVEMCTIVPITLIFEMCSF